MKNIMYVYTRHNSTWQVSQNPRNIIDKALYK